MTTTMSQRQNTPQVQPSRDESLILSYLDHVNGLVRRYAASARLDYDDLCQDATLVIMHCLELQPNRAAELHAYIRVAVRNRIIDKIRYNQCRQAVSLDAWREAVGWQDGGTTPDDLLPSGYNTDPLAVLLAQEALETFNAWAETREGRSRAANTRRVYRELADTVLASLCLDEEAQL